MKFTLFIVLFVGLICISHARTSFLDTIFLAATSQHSDVEMATSCNATDSCSGKGEACTGTYPIGCNTTNGNCCAMGLYCINKTCATDNIGDSCQSSATCHSNMGPTVCSNGTCQYLGGLGDPCSKSDMCQQGTCMNGTCQGKAQGQNCMMTSDCAFSLYCSAANNATCQNSTAEGANCTATSHCFPGTDCFKAGSNNYMTCNALGSQAENGPCNTGMADCASGLVCVSGNCTTVKSSSMVTCTANANCTGTGSACACSSVTGDQYCTGILYSSCTDEQATLQNCLADNKCTLATDAPNSCCSDNCESEYKKSSSCSCDLSSSVFSSCYYNDNCGGFPVWAIIVIIVVAIVLVLAIVLLVFFMMRRRRQYDSI